jgi:hypothetical protein
MINYYKPSGAFSPLSFAYFLGISLTALPILGLIYSYATWYIPFIYIRFFLTLGLGFVVGLLVNLVIVKFGKVRNIALAIIFGVVAALITLYFSWAVWLDLTLNIGESYGNKKLGITVSNIEFMQVFSLATQPSAMWDLIKQVNELGSISIKGSTISGIFLSIIWLIETGMVLGVATFCSMPQSKKPFCERTGTWFKEKALVPFDFIEDKEKIVTGLERATITVFDDLVPSADIATQNHSIFTLYSSENGENYLSIENKIAKIDDKGKTSFDSDEFIEYIGLSDKLSKILLEKENKVS